MPHDVFCPRQNNNITHFQNQRYIGIFMSLYIQEREREREQKREGEQEREQKQERERKSAGDNISEQPGPNEKICELHIYI